MLYILVWQSQKTVTNVLLCVEVVNYGKHDGEEDGGRQGDENKPEQRQMHRSGHCTNDYYIRYSRLHVRNRDNNNGYQHLSNRDDQPTTTTITDNLLNNDDCGAVWARAPVV